MTADKSDLKASPPRPPALRCRTVAAGGFKQFNYVRDLPPLTVEERFGPPAEALVATPSETLLAALGSCLSAHIHANAALASIVVHSLELDLEAESAASSLWGPRDRPPKPIGFETIRVAVRIQADASPEALSALVAHAVLWSPVANTIHDQVHLEVIVGETVSGGATSSVPEA
jgi:uncharacterized OsmC-like protein